MEGQKRVSSGAGEAQTAEREGGEAEGSRREAGGGASGGGGVEER